MTKALGHARPGRQPPQAPCVLYTKKDLPTFALTKKSLHVSPSLCVSSCFPSSHSQDKLFVLTRIYSTKSISKINWKQHFTCKQAPQMFCVSFLLPWKYLTAIFWISCCHLMRHFHLDIGFLMTKEKNLENAFRHLQCDSVILLFGLTLIN